LLGAYRTSTEALCQCLTIQVFQHQVIRLAFAAVVTKPADVRMKKRGDGSRLALEALAASAAVRNVGRKNFSDALRSRRVSPAR
jgi:hypothetical protein